MESITKDEERLVRRDTIQRIIDAMKKEKEQFETTTTTKWLELLKTLKDII